MRCRALTEIRANIFFVPNCIFCWNFCSLFIWWQTQKSYHSVMHWVRCYKTFWCNLRFVHKAVAFSTIITFIMLSLIFSGKGFKAAIRNLGAHIRKFLALDQALTLAPGCGSDSSSWPSSSLSLLHKGVNYPQKVFMSFCPEMQETHQEKETKLYTSGTHAVNIFVDNVNVLYV